MSKFWSICFIGTIYFISENRFFGFNVLPKSSLKIIADGIFLIIMAMAILAKEK